MFLSVGQIPRQMSLGNMPKCSQFWKQRPQENAVIQAAGHMQKYPGAAGGTDCLGEPLKLRSP